MVRISERIFLQSSFIQDHVGDAGGHRQAFDLEIGEIEYLPQRDGFAGKNVVAQFVENQDAALAQVRLDCLEGRLGGLIDIEIENRKRDDCFWMSRRYAGIVSMAFPRTSSNFFRCESD